MAPLDYDGSCSHQSVIYEGSFQKLLRLDLDASHSFLFSSQNISPRRNKPNATAAAIRLLWAEMVPTLTDRIQGFNTLLPMLEQ